MEGGGGGGGGWRGGRWRVDGRWVEKVMGPAKLNIRKNKYFILPPPGIAEAGPPSSPYAYHAHSYLLLG